MGNTPKKRAGSPATSRTTQPARTSLRDALAKKTSLRTYHDISVVSSDHVDRAQRQLEAARQMQAATMLHSDDDVKARATKLVEDAEAARAQCFHRLWFRGLGFTEFDALVALHPPTGEQTDEAWDPDTFGYALIAECVQDEDGTPGELTAEEWKAELSDESKWTRADRLRVIRMAMAAQQQTMADAVPKD